jgi:anti-sigma B factor antagonist
VLHDLTETTNMQVIATTLPGDILRLDLIGRLDIDGTREAEEAMPPMVHTRRVNLLVNLSQVSFMASVGLRLLLTLSMAQDRLGGRVVLALPRGIVRTVLDTAGIDQLMPVHDSLDAAEAEFAVV